MEGAGSDLPLGRSTFSSSAAGVGEVADSDYRNGNGITTLAGTQDSLALFAWLVPAETSSTVVTAEDGSRLPAAVYALSGAPGARLAVVFVEDETRSWKRPHRWLTSYDSTGAVVANWPIQLDDPDLPLKLR